MKKLPVLSVVVLMLILPGMAQFTPTGDAYTNTTTATTNYGAKPLLDVQSATQTSYIAFDLSPLPTGFTGANIAKATLKLYVNGVTTAGSFNVDFVNGTWTESTITASSEPALGTTVASSISLTTASKNEYISIDVTSAVQAWLNGTDPNYGLALVANSPLNATFDSKESTTQSHSPELDIVFANGGGTITGVTTSGASGLTGGGTTGTLNLSLTNSCVASQVLQWNGSTWACSNAGTGTVTGVTAGTALLGGGSSGNVALNVDVTKVPLLAANNTFTGNQTANGNLTATGVVTGSAYQIGSTLFAFGSTTTANAFTGFSGNTTMTGTTNTANGYLAFPANTTGSGNVADGTYALNSNGTGYNNTANGVRSLLVNNTGYENTATGYSALYSAEAFHNTATGAWSMYATTGGTENTASGYKALFLNQNGGSNTATGSQAMNSNTTGSANVASGYQALSSNTIGYGNVAEGYLALSSNTLGNYDTGVGGLAGNTVDHTVLTGNSNTFLGYGAAPSTGSLTNATAIGANAEVSTSNTLVLGAVKGVNGAAQNTWVVIGGTQPTSFSLFSIAQGQGPGTADGWTTYSSRRWKTNIQTLPDALGKVERLRGVSYTKKETGKNEIGVIAEEVGAVVPEIVTWESNGKDAQSVDYSRLTALLIEATKQQQAMIRAQQRQIRAEQKQIRGQQASLTQLTKEMAVIKTALHAPSSDPGVLTASRSQPASR